MISIGVHKQLSADRHRTRLESDGVDSHSPGKETQLGPPPAVWLLELKIINSPSTLILGKILQKFIVVRRARCFQHLDFPIVWRKVKDDVFMLPSLLEVGERVFGLLRDLDAGLCTSGLFES